MPYLPALFAGLICRSGLPAPHRAAGIITAQARHAFDRESKMI
jgi:hypothetical protein